MADRDDSPVGDKPSITETQWQAAAIASALLSIILGIAGSFWILGLVPPEAIAPDDMAARGRALTPIGTFLIAIVTFCTVAWRAKVIERQADAQERQLASADENNLALLLQKGAELIADEDLSKNSAGLACLSAIVTAENRRFGTEAMALLIRYVTKNSPSDFTTFLARTALAALRSGYENGNTTDAAVSISGNGKEATWRPVWGVREVTFIGAVVSELPEGLSDCPTPHRFESVAFRKIKVAVKAAMFDDCRFEDCRIVEFETYGRDRNTFDRCDFSGCRVHFDASDEPLDFAKLSGSGNYYHEGDPPLPPTGFESFDWKEYLHEEPNLFLYGDTDGQ